MTHLGFLRDQQCTLRKNSALALNKLFYTYLFFVCVQPEDGNLCSEVWHCGFSSYCLHHWTVPWAGRWQDVISKQEQIVWWPWTSTWSGALEITPVLEGVSGCVCVCDTNSGRCLQKIYFLSLCNVTKMVWEWCKLYVHKGHEKINDIKCI